MRTSPMSLSMFTNHSGKNEAQDGVGAEKLRIVEF